MATSIQAVCPSSMRSHVSNAAHTAALVTIAASAILSVLWFLVPWLRPSFPERLYRLRFRRGGRLRQAVDPARALRLAAQIMVDTFGDTWLFDELWKSSVLLRVRKGMSHHGSPAELIRFSRSADGFEWLRSHEMALST